MTTILNIAQVKGVSRSKGWRKETACDLARTGTATNLNITQVKGMSRSKGWRKETACDLARRGMTTILTLSPPVTTYVIC